MGRNAASLAHVGAIIGCGSEPAGGGHGNYWLDKIGAGRWQWLAVNPVHGTYHSGHGWPVPVGELPPGTVFEHRHHALFLLWGRPELRAGEAVPQEDVDQVGTALDRLAGYDGAQLDAGRPAMVPVLDVLVRAQFGGIRWWLSALHGDLLAPPPRPDAGLTRIRKYLAEPHLLAAWASPDGTRWARPAAFVGGTPC
ncbi:hypothetical protein JOF53_000021 [Crossiella equi]|uniref:Uncharacterized protein n=1 Tax=Crossiella equi TaxID=130796 RepID=A0ABS5A3K2_9PSEU|nr:hypothetical protein [Crossiella equi]MBP2471149.1 hypothetical protein [Crossiella equi]